MKTYEELAESIGNGSIIVMPDEDSVRSLLEYKIRNCGCSTVRMAQVISFDQFWDSFFPARRRLKKADAAIRHLFATDMVKNHSDKLTYFIPAALSDDNKLSFVSFISDMLPNIEDALNAGPEYQKDIEYLYDEYKKFLKRIGCYESSFTKVEDFAEPEGHYVIAFVDADPGLSRKLSYLIDDKKVVSADDVFKISSDIKPDLHVYKNERQEIRSVFMSINKTLRTGQLHTDEIAITVPDLATLRPYLERDAYLYDIPLDFKGGQTFRESPAGRFISYLDRLNDTYFDTYTLRDFAYDPAFPFKEREELQQYVLNAIRRGTTKILKEERFEGLQRSRLHFFGAFDDMLNASNASDFISAFKRLESRMLLPSTVWSKSFKHSWEMLQKSVAKLIELESTTGGFGNCEIFSLLLSSIMDSRYEEKSKGVGVYSWPASAYKHFKRNYVISMSEDRARLVSESAPFLAEYEKKGKCSVEDTTENAVHLSMQNADECIFSFSKETYEGKALPLTVFSSHVDATYNEDEDIWRYVPGTRGITEIPRVMNKGHENAVAISNDVYDNPFASMKLAENHEFSSTQLDAYNKCPYKYALDRFFKMDKAESYEIRDGWNTEIGTRIHKVEELYFNEASRTSSDYGIDSRLESLLEDQFDKWRNRISADGGALKDDVPYLTPEMEAYIGKKYLPVMKKFTAKYHGDYNRWACEVELNGKIEGYNFTGKADMVASNASENVILDWKTGDTPKDSVQFDVYRELLAPEYGRGNKATYLNLKEGKEVDHGEKEEDVEKIKNSCSKMMAGKWAAKYDFNNCKNCSYRRICRKGYGDDEE